MRFIPSHINGIASYAIALILIISPWLFAFARGGAETWLPVMVGIAIVVYTLLTDFELGFARMVNMKANLTLDAVAGLLLIVSPWLFQFAAFVVWPHVILGILLVLGSLTTHTVPGRGEFRVAR